MARAAGRQRAVDGKLANQARLGHRLSQTLQQKREQRVVLATLQLEPRRHGVTAAFDE